MKTTVKSFEKQVNITKPPKDSFWDHTDGGYDRKFVPGVVIWQWQHTGEITIKSDIDDEIARGKYTSINITLSDLSYNQFQDFHSTPTTVVLKRNRRYQLFVNATLIKDGTRIDETWILRFSPKNVKSLPPS